MKRSSKGSGRGSGSRISARRGGPANFQGTGYQIDVAVVEALRLIIPEQTAMADLLGTTRWQLARNIQVLYRSETQVREAVTDLARNLSGPQGAPLLSEMLSEKFRIGAGERRSFRIAELIEEMRAR